jgi:glycosyltransferase involved in cell wall biosynthesis
MRKILFIADWFDWRWWWKIASLMENYFSKKYNTVTLVAFFDSWFFPIKWKKINIWSLWKKPFPWRGYLCLLIHLINIFRNIKVEKPDIVICIWSYSNFLWLFAKRFFNFKLLLTQHEHITLKSKIYATLLDKMIFKFNKYLIWNSKIVCVSNEIKEDTVNYYKIPEWQAVVIYNWFDFEQIQSLGDEPVTIKEKYIINVWALSKGKNQKMLIKAYANSKYKSHYKLLLLWGWHMECKRELVSLTKELWIENFVIFAWFDKNPYKYLKHASMFCFTSLSEALPTVLIESLILKVPILTVPVIWAKEILDNWNCWIISKDWDVDEFSKLIDKYIEKDNSALIKRWYKFAEANFKDSTMMEKYERLLYNL